MDNALLLQFSAERNMCSSRPETRSDKNQTGGDKKTRPKDVFGRPLPTEEEFEVLKNAPRYALSILF